MTVIRKAHTLFYLAYAELVKPFGYGDAVRRQWDTSSMGIR